MSHHARRTKETLLYMPPMVPPGCSGPFGELKVNGVFLEAENDMSVQLQYDFLEARQRSNYKQFWVKGRHMRAEVLYRYTVGLEPESPEQVAKEYDLPVEAVLEAVDYCVKNQDLLDAERSREAASVRARGLDRYPHIPADYKPAE